MTFDDYIRPAISNGHPKEQALIRRWWHEIHGARGRLVWEYYLGDCYLDAMWFPEVDETAMEYPGIAAPIRFPIAGASVVLCEAKLQMTPELVGQALMYGTFAKRAGADIRSITVFAETGKPAFVSAAEELGLQVVISGNIPNPAA
jgi:hypothetical protein